MFTCFYKKKQKKKRKVTVFYYIDLNLLPNVDRDILQAARYSIFNIKSVQQMTLFFNEHYRKKNGHIGHTTEAIRHKCIELIIKGPL